MAKAGQDNNYEPAYDMIFSDRISRRVYFLTEKARNILEYYVKNMIIDEGIKEDVIELFLARPADWEM